MTDGSETVADWPILNALVNTAGATCVIADGTSRAARCLERALTSDPGDGRDPSRQHRL